MFKLFIVVVIAVLLLSPEARAWVAVKYGEVREYFSGTDGD